MKILLYEPGIAGHRPVILRYTIKVLERAGVGWAHENCDLASAPAKLVGKAREMGCDVIYILTLEKLVWFAWKLSWIAKCHGIRVVCTYYLFNNLREGWKSCVWRLILRTGNIDCIFVSDAALTDGKRHYPRPVRYLPDPWDPDEFPHWSQKAARRELTVPNDTVVFLMFGLIDERKGADLLLKAIERLGSCNPPLNLLFLFVGSPSVAVRDLQRQITARLPSNVQCSLHGHYITEERVSVYFFAADYIVNAYSSRFRVSSGSVTRGLAAGRAIIVPSHGVNGEMVEREKCGYTFQADCVESLADVLNRAACERSNRVTKYEAQCGAAAYLGLKRTLSVYGEYLLSALVSNRRV